MSPTAAPATEDRNTDSVANTWANPLPGGPRRLSAGSTTSLNSTSPRTCGAMISGVGETCTPGASAGTSTME